MGAGATVSLQKLDVEIARGSPVKLAAGNISHAENGLVEGPF